MARKQSKPHKPNKKLDAAYALVKADMLAQRAANEERTDPEREAANQSLEAASLKLNAAGAIVDLVSALEVQHDLLDCIKRHTLSTAMLHVGTLIEEARELIEKAEANHGA